MSSPAASANNNNNTSSIIKLTSAYSPTPIPATSTSTAYALAKLQAGSLPQAASAGDNKDSAATSSATTNRPIHCSIAIDCSSSMSGARIQEAKAAVDFIADQLRPIDYLGIVAFSSGVSVTLAKTRMDAAGKHAAHQAVNKLVASGSTFLSGGLFAAMSQVCDEAINPGPSEGGHIQQPFYAPNLRGGVPPGVGPYPFAPNMNNININAPPPPFYPGNNIPNLPAPQPQGIAVEISHTYNGNGNKPEEKHQYRLKLVAPEDKISQFTIHDPENRFSDILGSGETELELKPVAAPIQKLEISFELVSTDNKAEKKEHKINYFLGETPSGNKKINIPVSPSASATVTPTKPAAADDRINVVYLLTDGHANIGPRDIPHMNAALQERLNSATKNVTIFTFGFGTNHNAKMLEEIATVSEGSFYFIESVDKVAEIFADVLGGVLSVVAMNVRLTARLKAGNGVRFAEPMTKFKTKIEEDGNAIVITMKDIYAEESRDVLLALKVDGTTAKAAQVDGAVSVDWTLEFSDAANKNSTAVTIKLTNSTVLNISSDSAPVVDNEIDMQIQRFKSIQVMNEVRMKADSGDLAGARQVAQGYYTQLQAAPSCAMPTNIAIQQQMVDLTNLASDTTQWNNFGSKRSVGYAQAHAQQRSNDVSESAAYAGNAMKMEMRKKASEYRKG